MPNITDYLNDLKLQQKNLAQNLTTKGVYASQNELLNILVPKVLNIPQQPGELPQPQNFATDDFETIVNNPEFYPIGAKRDEVFGDLGKLTWRIWDVGVDEAADGSSDVMMTLGTDFLLPDRRQMNAELTNLGGWTLSDIRAFILDRVWEQIPEKMRPYVRMVVKKTTAGSMSQDIVKSIEYAFLPARVEIDGTTTARYAAEGQQYKFWKVVKNGLNRDDRINRLGNQSGQIRGYFFRSPDTLYTDRFRYINTTGGSGYARSTSNYGIQLCLCIGKKSSWQGEKQIEPVNSNLVKIEPYTNFAVTVDTFNFHTDVQGGKNMIIHYSLPKKGLNADTKFLFFLHGTGRNAAGYANTARYFAETQNFVTCTPHFSDTNFTGTAYARLNMMNSAFTQKRPENEWTGQIIDEIFLKMKQMFSLATDKYILYGHSAGGQFAHRFALFHQTNLLDFAIAANPGAYTFPDESLDFPHGIKNFMELKPRVLQHIENRKLYVIAGQNDNDRAHPDLDLGFGEQGPHRYSRGKNFFRYTCYYAKANSIFYNWEVVPANGVSHVSRLTIPFVLDILDKHGYITIEPQPQPESFETDDLRVILANTSFYPIGSRRIVQVGTFGAVEFKIWDKEVDRLEDGTTAPLTLGMTFLLPNRERMNVPGTTVGGWKGSQLRQWLQDNIIANLPIDWQMALQSVVNTGTIGGSSTVTQTSVEKVWFPSERNINGRIDPGYDQEGVHYKYWQEKMDNTDRVKTTVDELGTNYGWWTRSPTISSDPEEVRFRYFNDTGAPGSAQSNNQYGCCCVIAIGKWEEPEEPDDDEDY